jgi:hypothetical protein
MGEVFRIVFTLLMSSVLAAMASAGEVPDVVLQYADAFAQRQTVQEQLPPGRTVRDQYAHFFFQGYTHPAGAVFTKSPLVQDAYTHGQNYWREHPLERAKIFSEYGYVAVERQGMWSRGFEKSAFEPSDGDGGRWWMSPLGEGPWKETGLDQGGRVRIVGYLSPKGHYGHMGAYEHEVLVTSGGPVDSGDN